MGLQDSSKLVAKLTDRTAMAPMLEALLQDTRFPVANLWLRECVLAAFFLGGTDGEPAFPFDPGFQLTRRKPLGKLVCVLPGNGPLYTLFKVLGPALATGCEVVFSLPSRLKRSQALITELVAGLQPRVSVVYSEQKEDKSRFLKHAFVDPEVRGVIVFGDNHWIQPYRDLAQATHTKLIFEGPGNDPAVILPGADLSDAAAKILKGSLYNGGQSCSAIKRAYVHRDLLAELQQHLLEKVGDYQCGPVDDERTIIGPISGPRLIQRIRGQMQEARAAGARFLYGDGSIGEDGVFEPTLLICGPHLQVVREETFYPVLPIVPIASEDEARRHLTSCRYGLNAAVFGDATPAFRAFMWGMHKSVCFDSIIIDPQNREHLRLVGGFKHSGFISHWDEAFAGHAEPQEPNHLGPTDFVSSAKNYVTRQGRFYLEREISTAIPAWVPAG